MPSNKQEDTDESISLGSLASLQSYAHSEFESDHSFALSENIKLSSRKNNFLDTPENRLVWWSKLLVLLVMVLSAVASCVAAYLFTKQEERQDFKNAVRKFYFERLRRFEKGKIWLTWNFLCPLLFSLKMWPMMSFHRPI
jgi:ABC-type multidrug transport system fused ATPase/permease subunit